MGVQMKTAFITDSGTGKTVQEMAQKGIYSIPLQISYDQNSYDELEQLTLAQVHQLMREEKLLSTSLPSLGKIEALFTQLKEEGYERVFCIPICTGLSGTMNAMELMASQVGLVFESVDTHVTAVVQEYLIVRCKELYEAGKSIDELKAYCQSVIDTTDTLLLPNDLNHLKRGGRLTPMAALLGGLLKIKPVLQINQSTNGKIDVYDKVRTMSKAMDKVIDRLISKGVGEGYCIYVAHVDDEAGAKVYYDKIVARIPNAKIEIIPLVSVVGVHTGLGCQALQTFKMI